MADLLRLLAIYVAEPAPGRFEWVITERLNEAQWKEIGRAEEGSKTYKAAMAGGLVALQEMIPDPDVGPRQTQKQSDPSLVMPRGKVSPASPDPETDAEAPLVKPRKAAYFGFGPIR